MAEFDGKVSGPGSLQLLVLSNGLDYDDLAAALDKLKSDSKNAGTHKRRVLYWEGYSAMISRTTSLDGKANCIITFKMPSPDSDPATDGTVEVVELTKRQRGVVSGPCDIMGKKIKPPAAEAEGASSASTKGTWAIAWGEEDAQAVWDDLFNAEPVIYLTTSAAYVATRYKRVQCKTYSSSLKSMKELEPRLADLPVQLVSVSFTSSEVPSSNGYNTLVCGPVATPIVEVLGQDKSSVGYCAATSTNEIYDAFLLRRNKHLLSAADRLIAQMNVDTAKGLGSLIVASSMKDAGTARRNALMKLVYVHESKKAFINNCQADGDGIEMHIIRGEVNDSDFGKYGGIVFEMFYRADLSVFG